MRIRYLQEHLLRDVQKKMVFVGGPRQCGKTTLVKQVLEEFPYRNGGSGLYLNWDLDEDRQRILAKQWGEDDQLIVFDELHKYRRWKNWIKGIYDSQYEEHRFAVTGSARLDVYRRGGDSLLGRYHYWRLHPFTLAEIPDGMSVTQAFERLMTVGGFPEPFLDGDEREARRWRRERFDRVIRDDVRDLEGVRNISTLALFADALRARVGGLVVLSNLADDLEISPKTAKHWLEVLERMYVVFAVRPLVRGVPRAVRKPPKVYFFDNADVLSDEGARFENLVATTLLQRVHLLEDLTGHRYELRYIRDKQGREVDFVIMKDGVVDELIEVKLAERDISTSLRYYAERLQPRRATQVVARLRKPIASGRLQVQSIADYVASASA